MLTPPAGYRPIPGFERYLIDARGRILRAHADRRARGFSPVQTHAILSRGGRSRRIVVPDIVAALFPEVTP